MAMAAQKVPLAFAVLYMKQFSDPETLSRLCSLAFSLPKQGLIHPPLKSMRVCSGILMLESSPYSPATHISGLPPHPILDLWGFG